MLVLYLAATDPCAFARDEKTLEQLYDAWVEQRTSASGPFRLPQIPATCAAILDFGPDGMGLLIQTPLGYELRVAPGEKRSSVSPMTVQSLVPIPIQTPQVSLGSVASLVPNPYAESFDGRVLISHLLELEGALFDQLLSDPAGRVRRHFRTVPCAMEQPEEKRRLVDTVADLGGWPDSWREMVLDPPAGTPFESDGVAGHVRLLGDAEKPWAAIYLVWWLESAFPDEVDGYPRNVTAMKPGPTEDGISREYMPQYASDTAPAPEAAPPRITLLLGKPGRARIEGLLTALCMSPHGWTQTPFMLEGMPAVASLMKVVRMGVEPVICVLDVQVVLSPDALLEISCSPGANPSKRDAVRCLRLAGEVDHDRLREFIAGDVDAIPTDLMNRIENQKEATRRIRQQFRDKPATRE